MRGPGSSNLHLGIPLDTSPILTRPLFVVHITPFHPSTTSPHQAGIAIHGEQKPTTARPTMPTTINHTAYPLLIDTIIDFAPISSLLALRRTSKAFCARIDRRLFRHAALIQPEGHAWMYIVFPTVDSTRPRHLFSLPFACQAIEILDVDRENFPLVPTAYHSANPLETLVNLKVVRRIGWSRRSARLRHQADLDTVVDYIDVDDVTDDEFTLHLLPGQRRHVAHLRQAEVGTVPRVHNLHGGLVPGRRATLRASSAARRGARLR